MEKKDSRKIEYKIIVIIFEFRIKMEYAETH
jgi:hypothetical protein